MAAKGEPRRRSNSPNASVALRFQCAQGQMQATSGGSEDICCHLAPPNFNEVPGSEHPALIFK